MVEHAFHRRTQRPQGECVAHCKRRWLWPIFGERPEIASSEDYGHPVADLISGKRVPPGQACFDEMAALQMFSWKAGWQWGGVLGDHHDPPAEKNSEAGKRAKGETAPAGDYKGVLRPLAPGLE